MFSNRLLYSCVFICDINQYIESTEQMPVKINGRSLADGSQVWNGIVDGKTVPVNSTYFQLRQIKRPLNMCVSMNYFPLRNKFLVQVWLNEQINLNDWPEKLEGLNAEVCFL